MKKYTQILLGLAMVGALFTGYLSVTTHLTGICGFSEPCPIFQGHPACYVDFALFGILLVIAALGWKGMVPMKNTYKVNAIFSALGVVFAGRIILAELMHSKAHYTLGVSTCLYGILFYLGIFAVSLIGMKKKDQ